MPPRSCTAFVLASILCSRVHAAPPPPPDLELECALKAQLLATSIARLPWSADAGARVHDALQLDLCPGAARPAVPPAATSAAGRLVPPRSVAHVFVDSMAGDDGRDGRSPAAAVRTLPVARTHARALRASLPTGERLVVEVRGTHYLQAPLALDSPLDSNTTWRGAGNTDVPTISGGVPFAGLAWAPSSVFPPPVLEAALPEGAPLDFTALFDGGSQRRLPLAREPNGDAETQMQPTGWALVRGNVNGTLTPPSSAPAVHFEVDQPARNSSVFPVWGRDFDPRNAPAGYVWYAEGGQTASFYANNRTYWANHTIEGGLRWNRTGGIDPHSGVYASPFNATGWAASQPGVRAHVFHNGLWGNWVFDVDVIDDASSTMTFSAGGFQEGRGGSMSTQPFFIEGAKEALDAPAEWWVDRARGVLHLWPNDTASGPPALLVAPAIENLITVSAASSGLSFEGITFAHTSDGLMQPYASPAAGDWSIRLAGAVVVDGAADVSLSACLFRRVGGNGLLVTGSASNTAVDSCDFYLPGGSAIAIVGFVPRANASEEGAAFPVGVQITQSIFEGIGVYGKQTSAVFVSVACNVSVVGNVLFSGPRSGININDGFCGHHAIERNVIFDWVRETQDHGNINTWDRSLITSADGSPKSGWVWITHNAILNGPSNDRDLGNLYPSIDNDDGSQFYWNAYNVAVYGGMKNYLGLNKKWVGNLIIFPGRWSGDACLTAWGGQEHVYSENYCVASTDSPMALDSSVEGNACVMNYSDPTTAPWLPLLHDNVYSTPDGVFSTGCDTMYDLAQLQAQGQEIGSTVVKGYTISDLVARAAALLA